MQKNLISIVIPCFNEEKMIPIFYEKVLETIESILTADFELIFVNDGSKDHTLEVIREIAKKNEIVHYLSFSRNFGKEAAMYAGMKHAEGDYVVVIDVDLQDPPELLPKMYDMLKNENYDCIATRRTSRDGEPKIRSFFARYFYKLINRISDTQIVEGARDYRMMTRQMVDVILEMAEYNRFSKGIFSWVGFETKYLEFDNYERAGGETKWSFWSLFKYSLDGIVAFSETPLAIASVVGFITFIIAVLMAIFYFVRTLIFGNPTSGWTSLVVIILALGGVQLLSLGILGKYIGKTYLETKKRPIYILKETDEDLK